MQSAANREIIGENPPLRTRDFLGTWAGTTHNVIRMIMTIMMILILMIMMIMMIIIMF
jgi:hypothetical protein